MIDFHGSTGYGQGFTDAIRGDWGGKPLVDLQKGLDAAIAKYAWLDGNKVCALGASYGGYMINWIAGNWPDRFKCLVNHDGNLDERMAYYDTEELWFPEWEHGGTPWDNPAGYTKHNPIDHVAKWKTPMLVIHGGRDYRVVDTQGMSTFTALQRKGIPSRFLYFPDENHWVLKPANSILWHETVLGWMDRWLKQPGGGTSAQSSEGSRDEHGFSRSGGACTPDCGRRVRAHRQHRAQPIPRLTSSTPPTVPVRAATSRSETTSVKGPWATSTGRPAGSATVPAAREPAQGVRSARRSPMSRRLETGRASARPGPAHLSLEHGGGSRFASSMIVEPAAIAPPRRAGQT